MKKGNSSWKMLKKAKIIQMSYKIKSINFKMRFKRKEIIVPKCGQMSRYL